MTSKRRKPFFERVKHGLEEGIAYAKGEINLRTVEIPEDPPEIDAETVAALRTEAAMSQAVFAKLLNVSTKTLQSWEQGIRVPSEASRRLIQVFSEHPEAVCKTVGLPAVTLGTVETKSVNGRRRIVVKRRRSR